MVPRKAQQGKIPQKCLCIDYHALNSLLLPGVKAHGVLSLVPLPKN